MLLHQEHMRTRCSREMSIFFMRNEIIDEDREEKLVALLASLCCRPFPDYMHWVCALPVSRWALIPHILPVIQLQKAQLPSLPPSCPSAPVSCPGAALAGRTSTQRDIQRIPAVPMKEHTLRDFGKFWQASAEYVEDDVFHLWHQARCRRSHDRKLASCQIFSLCFKTLGILNLTVVINYAAQQHSSLYLI